MITLHIEHPISDFNAWHNAFSGFAAARARAGVRAYTVRQPLDDPHYVLIDLEFDAADAAEAFRNFLHEEVWANRRNSPALVGTPVTRVLEIRDAEGRLPAYLP